MKNWKSVLVQKNITILNVIQIIDRSGMTIALVVDKAGKLLGTVTDGDIRRGILLGISLEQPVHLIMNPNPCIVKMGESIENILEIMRAKSLRAIPVVDDRGIVTGIELLSDTLHTREHSNWVVLMAGGLGSRLQELTSAAPKPLLKVGTKPVLETILESFITYGFRYFYLTVNYRAEMIEEYFGDGSKWGVEIRYVREDSPLGTAGALSLLPEKPKLPMLVMNGDVLTKVNFKNLLDFHTEQSAIATMGVREYDFRVPYGVVNLDGQNITNIDEKPVQRFFVNAGIYVLDPKVLRVIPKNKRFDMTTLFEKLIKKKHSTAAFPIREYWLDIGQMADFERAKKDFPQIFGEIG